MSNSNSKTSLQQQKSSKQPPLPSDLKAAAPFLQGAKEIKPIIATELSKLYERRAKRLEILAQKAGEDGEEYLHFLYKMVRAQKNLLEENPLTEEALKILSTWLKSEDFPTFENFQKAAFLQKQYCAFYQKISSFLPKENLEAFEKLANDSAFFATQSWHLLNGQFQKCDAALAVPLWASLSLCWAQAAQAYIAYLEETKASIPSHAACPCCGSPAVADMVMVGAQEGLRYEQCALCETRWHKVRSICPECLGSEHIDYWSVKAELPAIEIESCGDCKTYSKIFRFDRDPHHEICSDDLASLVLDALVEEKGFVRRTVNPFAFPFPAK